MTLAHALPLLPQPRAAADDEATACGLQGMIFHDSDLGMCVVTNWGVDYGTNILYYSIFPPSLARAKQACT